MMDFTPEQVKRNEVIAVEFSFTMYTNPEFRENRFNTLYPEECTVISSDPDSLLYVARWDSVSAKYTDNKRANKNFISSDVLVMDLDNVHSDDPAEWKGPEDIKAAYPGIPFAVSTSRNHLREKDGRSARPRYHVYFPIDPISDFAEYRRLKEWMLARFPAFDGNAKDSGRLFYGSPDPQVQFFEVESGESD